MLSCFSLHLWIDDLRIEGPTNRNDEESELVELPTMLRRELVYTKRWLDYNILTIFRLPGALLCICAPKNLQ